MARKVFRFSGKFSEITNMWMIRVRLLIKDNRKFKKAESKKLRVMLTTVTASKAYTI